MRILLVEDNLINQQVAQELLQSQGAQLVLADNGALGLAALYAAKPPFDVVLMDLQMPVMDGLKATRKLRADPRFAQLPVIAMTANAMHSDREECLAAGMNDHVGKPFDLGELVQMLLRHTRHQPPAAGAASGSDAAEAALQAQPQQPQEPAPQAPEWPAAIAVEQALARMGGNRQLLARAMRAFVEDAQQLPQRLAQLLQAEDAQPLKRELHSLKGLSATLGVGSLSALAAQAEKLALQPDAPSALATQLQQLQSAIAECVPLLEQVAWSLHPVERRAQAQAAPLVLSADARQQLQALLAALLESDMAAMELHAKLMQDIGANMTDAMAALNDAMADLDFEAAAQACNALVQQITTTQDPVAS